MTGRRWSKASRGLIVGTFCMSDLLHVLEAAMWHPGSMLYRDFKAWLIARLIILPVFLADGRKHEGTLGYAFAGSTSYSDPSNIGFTRNSRNVLVAGRLPMNLWVCGSGWERVSS